jgi:hypothetical protein
MKTYNPLSVEYASQTKLDSKANYLVKTCYIQSAQEFYVHLQNNESILNFDVLHFDLQRSMPNAPQVVNFRKNLCVGIMIDSEWHRGRVVDFDNNNNGSTTARVQVYDYGIVEEVHSKNIRMLPNKFLEIPSFAYRCCLSGFENIEVSDNITVQFEMLCKISEDPKVLKMKIIEIDSRHMLVELEDESVHPPANTNKILLKNSRPLAETITLENAKKRQKENQNKRDKDEMVREVKSPDRNRSSSQRGRGNYSSKGVSRSSVQGSPPRDQSKRTRTHFKSHENELNDDLKAKEVDEAVKSPSKSERKNQQQKMKNSPEKKKQQNGSETKQEKTVANNQQKQQESKQIDAIKSKDEKSSDAHKIGWISTLTTVNKAYVHFEEHVEDLERILNELFSFYENQKREFSFSILKYLKFK